MAYYSQYFLKEQVKKFVFFLNENNFILLKQHFFKVWTGLKNKNNSFRKTEYNQGDYVEQQTPANNCDHSKPNREMSKSPALKKQRLLF